MKVANIKDTEIVTDDHPTGALGFHYLLQGETGSPENFIMLVAENLGRFDMVRHRHNFDQFRFCISGDMEMGGGRRLKEGHLGYFPEGAPYGPQADDSGRIAMVIQFGGASGYGYMSPRQYRDGRESLSRTGSFEGPVYIREKDGKKTFSINAIWEETMGAKMLIPAPRYDAPIFMNPEAYRWVPVMGRSGVLRKTLGTFSEREVKAEIWSLRSAASYEFIAGDATRLLFALEGHGKAGAQALETHGAVQLDPGESTEIHGEPELTLLSFTFPPVNQDWLEAGLPSFEPVPGESVEGEARDWETDDAA